MAGIEPASADLKLYSTETQFVMAMYATNFNAFIYKFMAGKSKCMWLPALPFFGNLAMFIFRVCIRSSKRVTCLVHVIITSILLLDVILQYIGCIYVAQGKGEELNYCTVGRYASASHIHWEGVRTLRQLL